MHWLGNILGFKDTVKGGIKERFAELREMGIKTIMITGDNPLTAAAIAAVGIKAIDLMLSAVGLA
jgi:P-type E1-E2 ATPase